MSWNDDARRGTGVHEHRGRASNPLATLDACATLVHCRPGQEIGDDHNPAEYWYRVVHGVARKCFVLPSGRRQIVDLLLNGDFFSIDRGHEHYCYGEPVVDRTVVAVYPRQRVQELATGDPRVARLVNELALRAADRLQTQLLILGRTTALAKVSSFLLNMEDRLATERGGSIELPMSRYDIADYLAISVETVSRALTGLADRGVIRFSGARRLNVLDHDALRTGRARAAPAPGERIAWAGRAAELRN